MLFYRVSENGPGRKRSLTVILPKFPFAEGCLDAFEYLQGWGLHKPPGQPVLVPGRPSKSKSVPDAGMELPVFLFVPTASCIITEHDWKEPVPVTFIPPPSGIHTHWWVHLEPSLLQAEQTQLFQSFLTQEMIQAFDHLHSPSLDLSSTPTSPLYSGALNYTSVLSREEGLLFSICWQCFL